MKKFISLIAFMLVAFCILSCDKETEEGLSKSDIVGTWVQHGAQIYHSMKINSDNTYEIYHFFNGQGGYRSELSGTYSFDPKARVWVQHRNDGHSYTNIILILDETTFSYVDQYGNNDIYTRK